MAIEVIKRNGTKEPFDGEKIRKAIEGSVRDAGLSAERSNEVVNRVSSAVLQFAAEKEEIPTAELAEKILSELGKIEPGAAAAFSKYEQEKRR